MYCTRRCRCRNRSCTPSGGRRRHQLKSVPRRGWRRAAGRVGRRLACQQDARQLRLAGSAHGQRLDHARIRWAKEHGSNHAIRPNVHHDARHPLRQCYCVAAGDDPRKSRVGVGVLPQRAARRGYQRLVPLGSADVVVKRAPAAAHARQRTRQVVISHVVAGSLRPAQVLQRPHHGGGGRLRRRGAQVERWRAKGCAPRQPAGEGFPQ